MRPGSAWLKSGIGGNPLRMGKAGGFNPQNGQSHGRLRVDNGFNFDYLFSIESRSIAVGAEVAQSVEQWTENPRVGGSIPSLGTKGNQRVSWR